MFRIDRRSQARSIGKAEVAGAPSWVLAGGVEWIEVPLVGW
jgi:hypothetical protein